MVARWQPGDLPRRGGGQQADFQLLADVSAELFQERQPPADPALVPAQQLRHLALGQAVFTHQRLNQPRFLQLVRPPTGLVEPVNRRLGPLVVDLDQAHQQRGHSAYLLRRLPAREAVEHLRLLLAQGRHDRRALSPTTQRLRHHLDRLRHAQTVASELVSQLVEAERGDLSDRARIHGLVSSGRGSEKGAGGPEQSRNPPAPSSFGGNPTLCRCLTDHHTRQPTQGPRQRPVESRCRARRARCLHRRSRSITRRNA